MQNGDVEICVPTVTVIIVHHGVFSVHAPCFVVFLHLFELLQRFGNPAEVMLVLLLIRHVVGGSSCELIEARKDKR